MLMLKDHTYVVLSSAKKKLTKDFSKKNNNLIMRIKGRIIVTSGLLAKYGVIGSDGTPHLFNISEIRIIDDI